MQNRERRIGISATAFCDVPASSLNLVHGGSGNDIGLLPSNYNDVVLPNSCTRGLFLFSFSFASSVISFYLVSMLLLTTRVLLSLTLALLTQCSLVRLAPRAYVLHDPSELSDEYDYIVIGGGTSGLTVANRLTENPESMAPPFCASKS